VTGRGNGSRSTVDNFRERKSGNGICVGKNPRENAPAMSEREKRRRAGEIVGKTRGNLSKVKAPPLIGKCRVALSGGATGRSYEGELMPGALRSIGSSETHYEQLTSEHPQKWKDGVLNRRSQDQAG